MFSRKFSSTIRRKQRMVVSTIILLVVFLSVGYAAIESDLSINGTLNVSKYDQTLYGVLKEAVRQGYAQEYTGNHQDTMAGVGTEKIYHWYAPSTTAGDTLANEILDKNNVIFANHCWQMIRTTDTGGVKMIYNGEAENNQCLNTRGNHVGYDSVTTQDLSTTYYYGTSYTYDKTNNVFSLDGTVTTGTINQGEYTCKQTTSTGTCSTLYLVDTLSSGTTYYVLSLNGNSHYSQFGVLQFNQELNSPSYVGYMYNTVYPYQAKTMTDSERVLSTETLNTTYWYANSVTWGNPTANKYNLNSPYQVSSSSEYPNLVGKYTFRNTSDTYTNTSVYYIAAVSGDTMYYIELDNTSGSTHDLSFYNHTYTYGDSYRDNGNGTYTVINQDESTPTIIERKNWRTSYHDIGEKKYICKNAVNDTCNELWYTTSTDNTSMTYIKSSNKYKYAKEFEYKEDPDDGVYKYFLKDDNAVSFWNINDSTNKTSLNNAHYTCWNDTGKCTTISYIYYIFDYYISGITPHYIDITNGKSVVDAVNEMLYNNDVNQTNSTIKTGIDAWYKRYMTGYTSKLEDTIFCNDRSQSNQSANGWNPNGGSTSTILSFKNDNANSDLSCTNTTDKFSMANSKAKLTYPVGLLASPETYLLNNNNIRKTGQSYWLGSPYNFLYYHARERFVDSTGDFSHIGVRVTYGLRPAVSLTPGTEYTSGTGSMSDPYIIE